MNYRTLGRTGFRVSEIGMGLEHLLDKEGRVVADTIRAAVGGGVTYLDCHMGHDYKEDVIEYEGYEKLGKALQGVRDKLILSYIAHFLARSPADAQPRFESYLRALGTDHTDVFILQFCDKASDYEQVTAENGLLAYARKLKAEGKARSIGLSTHSTEIARKAVQGGEIDVLMFPVNPAFDVVIDEELYKTDNLDTLWDAAHDFTASGKSGSQPRRDIYGECERGGVGLVAMKPFAGGFIFNVEKNAGFTPVNLIAYALAQSGVSTVVPGCTGPREIEEILTYHTSSEERRDYGPAVRQSRWSVTENCLYCNHCLPCGAGINIGGVNRLLDAAGRAGTDISGAAEAYRAMPVKASACIRCGACTERCPFQVKAPDRMKMAAELFETHP